MTAFTTSRDIAATPTQVFAAISDPARLARWWGPAGFLEPQAIRDGTRVAWRQEFDSAGVARRIESIVVPANEQNLDRLTAEVLRKATER